MILGIPKETFPGEARVALVPAVLAPLKKAGCEFLLESGAGEAAGYPDSTFEEKGVRIASSREEVFREADVILQVRAYDLRMNALSIVETLHAVRSFFDCSDEVRRDEFARYTRDARSRHPAIHVMEWIPHVTEEQRRAHEARVAQEARKAGLAGYEIRERSASISPATTWHSNAGSNTSGLSHWWSIPRTVPATL